MKLLQGLRPASFCIYFIAVISIAMFSISPILRLICLAMGIINAVFLHVIRKPLRDFIFYFFILLLISFSNPLFNTRGNTVLFYVVNRAYTLEALFYGINNAAVLLAVLVWFRIFSEIMTSDKINSMLKSFHFHSLASILTLTLRYIPTFKQRYNEIHMAHKTSGLLSDEFILKKIASQLRVFFSLATYSFEMSASTAESMKARGYLLENHTDINRSSVKLSDIIIISLTVILFVMLYISIALGSFNTSFYPDISIKFSKSCAIVYFILCTFPTVFQAKEELSWRFYQSKI